MAETATLNVRMDADTKRDFSLFCEELGMSASSLMNVFAKTVVRNQAVPFPLTSRVVAVSDRYARLFPQSDIELMEELGRSAATPIGECVSPEEGMAAVKEKMGW